MECRLQRDSFREKDKFNLENDEFVLENHAFDRRKGKYFSEF